MTSFTHSTPTSPELAATKARQLFGCFRKGDANDPDTYAAAITAVLTRFPPEVVAHVTDPRTGLPSRSNFLPTVYEVRLACEECLDGMTWAAKRAKLEREQLAERQQYEQQRANALTRAEIEAKLGRPIGRPIGHIDSEAIGNRLKAAHGISEAEWAAIEDAKPLRHALANRDQ